VEIALHLQLSNGVAYGQANIQICARADSSRKTINAVWWPMIGIAGLTRFLRRATPQRLGDADGGSGCRDVQASRKRAPASAATRLHL
jgi:hypothetical protein